MSPDELAQAHSQIIDAKLNAMRELFKSVNDDPEVARLLNTIELNNEGRVVNSPKNKKVINAAIGLVRKKTNALRPIVFEQYTEAKQQINTLATDYISWLKKEK